ncbi:MAG: N-acetylmuramoyl-L-alanine amidase [Rhizobiaceae bacterium]
MVSWLVFVCLLLILPVSVAIADDQSAKPIAFAARIVGDENRGRLLIDFDKSVDYEVFLLDEPQRIVMDLSETLFSLEGEVKGLPRSLIKAFRYGSIGEGRSRVVLELLSPATVESHRIREIASENRHRLFVDFKAASTTDFAKLTRDPAEIKQPDIVKKRAKPRQKFNIVLDPGHGGIDGGAAGERNTIEKNVTLAFALQLRNELIKNERFNVIMTRDDDTFLGLTKRLQVARDSKADLFLSIHADSLAQKSIRGATVYTLSDKGSDRISRMLARRQNRTDLIAGLKLPEVKPQVSDIFIDMTRRETEVFSNQFAGLLVQRMRDGIKLIRNPHRSADFFVLKAPEVPSVLLELGYLSNLEDEALMGSKEWQTLAVQRTHEAIADFFDIRLAQK